MNFVRPRDIPRLAADDLLKATQDALVKFAEPFHLQNKAYPGFLPTYWLHPEMRSAFWDVINTIKEAGWVVNFEPRNASSFFLLIGTPGSIHNDEVLVDAVELPSYEEYTKLEPHNPPTSSDEVAPLFEGLSPELQDDVFEVNPLETAAEDVLDTTHNDLLQVGGPHPFVIQLRPTATQLDVENVISVLVLSDPNKFSSYKLEDTTPYESPFGHREWRYGPP